MAVDDLINVRKQILKHIYIPTEIKGALMRFDVNCNWKEQVVGSFHGGLVIIHSIRQTISILLYIMFHALMGKISVRTIYFYYLFFHRHPTQQLCSLSCRPFVVNATFSTYLSLTTKGLRERKQLLNGTTVKKQVIKIINSN